MTGGLQLLLPRDAVLVGHERRPRWFAVLTFEDERRLHWQGQHRWRTDERSRLPIVRLILNRAAQADRSPEQRTSRHIGHQPWNNITLRGHRFGRILLGRLQSVSESECGPCLECD